MPPVAESPVIEGSTAAKNADLNFPNDRDAINKQTLKSGSKSADASVGLPAASKDGFGMWKHPHEESGGRAEAAVLSLFSVYIYYKTLPPSITGGDSGEVRSHSL